MLSNHFLYKNKPPVHLLRPVWTCVSDNEGNRIWRSKTGSSQQELRSIKSTRKSSYTKYASKCRFQIAKKPNETGCKGVVRKFKSLFPHLNESTVRGFRKKSLKLAEKRNRSPEKLMVNLQRGRPLLLGNDIDEKVRKYIMTLRSKGR